MKIFMETTKISTSVTVGQIQGMLAAYGASQILTQYQDKEICGLSFKLTVNGQDVPFSLPCRYEAILKVLRRGSTRTPLADLEAKAKRVAWRQLLRWIEAQLALVSTEMVTAGEVFMPYMQVRDGRTLYQLANESGFKMLDMK